MSAVEIRRVQTRRERRIFLTFPWRIYHNDPLWVPPLIPERARLIDPARGPFFKRGTAEFFIAWRAGQPVGTICASEDRAASHAIGVRECLFGFFECIEDYPVARALLDHVRGWAHQQGLSTLYGPFNLDREDSYGVLVEGRDRPPVILCGHTPPYYLGFLERYGLEPARGDNLAFAIDVNEDTPALRRLSRLAAWLRRQGHITIREADFSRWQEESVHVHRLMNSALAHLPDHIPWPLDAVQALLEPFLTLADPALILFAEVDGHPVGFFPGLPDINEAFIHANGLCFPWDYVRLWWHWRRPPECLTIKSVLVLPEYWSKGVAVLFFDEMLQRIRARSYRWVDLSLTSEDNPYTPRLAASLDAHVYKRYRVYRMPV